MSPWGVAVQWRRLQAGDVLVFITVVVGFSHGQYPLVDDNPCPRLNKYMQSLHQCRPNEFYQLIACEGDNMELRCPRSKYVAVHSATFGWSEKGRHDCVSSPATIDAGCRLGCVVQVVMHLCHGRRRCTVESSDETFGNPCRPGAPKYLGVTYTCVSKNTLREMDSPDADLLSPCGSNSDDFGGHGDLPDWQPPSTTIQTTTPTTTTTTPTTTTTRRTTTTAATTTTTRYVWPQISVRDLGASDVRVRTQDKHLALPSSTTQPYRSQYWQPQTIYRVTTASIMRGHVVPSPITDVKTAVTSHQRKQNWIILMSDWVLTFQFVSENKEKFVLYMLLGLCLGTITILLVVICQLVLPRSSRRHKSESLGGAQPVTSTTWRVPESESSTGDDRTLSNEDDIEMTGYNHIGTLQRTTASTTRPESSMSHQVTSSTATATINRSYAQANAKSRCFSPTLATSTYSTTASGNAYSSDPTAATTAASVVMNGTVGGGVNSTSGGVGSGGVTAASGAPGYGGYTSHTLSRLSSAGHGSAPGHGTLPGHSSGHGSLAYHGSMTAGHGTLPASSAGPGSYRTMGSLSRTYTNPYGRDGYHHVDLQSNTAGTRTLQPLQHYYG